MSRRTIVICVIVLLLLIGGGYGLHRYLAARAPAGAYATDFTAVFEAEKETAGATRRYEAGAAPAKVLAPQGGEERRVFLYLCGLPDRAETEKVVDVLEKEDIPCAFFVEGQNAADELETMKLLHKKGFLIGNYTWLGTPAFETLSVDEALASLAKTQKAIHVTSQTEAKYFKAPRTEFTETVLKEAGAAGLSYAVESNVTIRRGEISSAEAAAEWAKSIRPGSFIAFEVNRPVMEKAQERGKYDERPAIDKKPTIKDRDFQEEPKRAPLEDQIRWLIEALKNEGYTFVSLERAS